MWFSLCLCIYKIGRYCFASTTFVHLALFPPAKEENMTYTFSQELRSKMNKDLNADINETKQIIQVANTAFTEIRLEISRHDGTEIPYEEKQEIGYLIIRAYADLVDNFNSEDSTCIPLEDLESIKERLHAMGVIGEDHMLTVGGND
eukprot:UN02133